MLGLRIDMVFGQVHSSAIQVKRHTVTRSNALFKPECRVPKFIAFGQVHNTAIRHIDKYDFGMSAICIRKRRHHQIIAARNPFAMVKRITLRGCHRLNQFARAISHKNAFMRTVLGSDKITPGLAAKIKEQGAFAAILGKRGIARLFFIIPDNARFAHSCAKESSACYRQRIVFANTTMISTIKQLLRFAKFTICKSHLPSRSGFEIRLILVVSGVSHIYDCGITIFKYTPTRNCRTFDIKLYKIRAFGI